MARKDATPSYVLELEMKTTAYDRKILGKKTRIGKKYLQFLPWRGSKTIESCPCGQDLSNDRKSKTSNFNQV